MSQTNDSTGLADLPTPDYKYIQTTEEALRHIEFIERHPVIEVDTETTGLDPLTEKVVLLQLGVNGKSFVFDMRKGNVEASMFKHLLESKKHLKLLQNAVFDYEMLKTNFNIELERVYDTMLAEQVISKGSGYYFNLNDVQQRRLGLPPLAKDVREGFFGMSQKQPFSLDQIRYAAADVEHILELMHSQEPFITRY